MIWPGLMRIPSQVQPHSKAKRWVWVCICAYLLLGISLYWELSTSVLHSRIFTALNHYVSYQVGPGPSSAIAFPRSGPYNERLGYTALPEWAALLQEQDFEITTQVRSSPLLRFMMALGLFAPYPEKSQNGLAIYDALHSPIYSAQYPQRQYTDYAQIPALLVQSIVYIENRELLDLDAPTKNPAVEWKRLAKAVYDKMIAVFSDHQKTSGGSTIAVQIEKYRHSPHGATVSVMEKLRQILSASFKAYRYDRNTIDYRHHRLMDYLNTVPLAAYPHHGEINGIGDGLWAWYDVPFDRANQVLQRETDSLNDTDLAEQARIYKQALSLLIAHRRPSYYLLKATEPLEKLTDSYLENLAGAGIISSRLAKAALSQDLAINHQAKEEGGGSFITRKAATATRVDLGQLLKNPSLYDLDRLDLAVETTINNDLQYKVTEFLSQLKNEKFARNEGLSFHRTSSRVDPSDVVISFTLHEKGANANYLRVQTDSYDQPFNMNSGAKMGLGSSAKLRVLVHYLDLVANLYEEMTGLSEMELLMKDIPRRDRLSRWVVDQLIAEPELSLEQLLQHALDRRYSASTQERFFTAGGMHRFSNFSSHHASRLTVRKAFYHSVNLVFIRLMRDIVEYYIADNLKASPAIFDDVNDPRRREYLERFADYEGINYLKKFYNKYRGKTERERIALLLKTTRPVPKRLAIIYRSLYPQASFEKFAGFLLEKSSGTRLAEQTQRLLYDEYGIDQYNLSDRGYLAHIHPLELWLVGRLINEPDASLRDLIAQSRDQRQEVYGWLFRTNHKRAQDNRIRILLEQEAFVQIHRQWKKLGYPFSSLVASYATAIGSSADRPEALAELMGILVNDGIRKPRAAIQRLSFAKNTPYETVFEWRPSKGERVLPVEVAQAVKQELRGVVENGTARQLRGAFKELAGGKIGIGGKTGTGDNRYKTFAKGGRLLHSRVVDRTATFAFLIDDRFYGTISLYVAGEAAEKFKFTSSLPVKILAKLAPILSPIVHESVATAPQGGEGENLSGEENL